MNTNHDYQIIKGKIISENGLPILPRWFCDDKLSVKFDQYGISEVQYFNTATHGSFNTFVEDMWGGIKFYMVKNGRRSYLNLTHTEVMPWGFVSTWDYEGQTFRFEQRVINNCIYCAIEAIDAHDNDLELSMEVYESFAHPTYPNGNYRLLTRVPRTWAPWTFENETLHVSFVEEDKYCGECHVAFGGPRVMHGMRKIGFPKHLLTFPNVAAEKAVLVIAFDSTREAVDARLADVLAHADAYIAAQDERYQKVMDRMPVLESAHPLVNEFFMLSPLYHEAFKLKDYPGAIRARTNIYWVWGWDGMSSGNTYSYWGDNAFAGQMLNFYMKTAIPGKGIAHSFTRQMTHGETSMISAQGFYISLLYSFYKHGGDIAPYYDFAKEIFRLIQSVEVNNLGLCSGMSLVPDFRELILEDGHDLSCFNNTSAYCAVRSMEELARAIGDTETCEKAAAFAARTRENFNRLLFDKEVGYYFSSASSIDLSPRKTYMGMELKWDNEFCRELLGDTMTECLRFFEEKLVNKAGLNVFPLDNEVAYDADSNQGHCWWPAHSEYYTRAVNSTDRPDLMKQFMGWIENWTALLMMPEGINCYVDTDVPFVDNWNAEPGTWQAFGLRAWYEAIVHSIVGVDLSGDKLTFYPYSGEEMSILGLHIGKKTVDVHMKGSGKNIASITVDGKAVTGTNAIPVEQLAEHSAVTVVRC